MDGRLPGATLLLLLAAACGGKGGAGETDVVTSARGASAPAAQPALPPMLPALPEPTALVEIPAGSWRPFYPGKDEPPLVEVGAFQLEEHAVTNRQYLAFVKANPQWRKSQVAELFADDQYLFHWTGDLEFPPQAADAPVVNVSWYAARSYARWIGRRLPTLAEWEQAARASESSPDGSLEAGFEQRILDWYAKPTPEVPAPVRSGYRNVHGAWDMHGLIWEWVEDFNTALVTGESRGNSGLERELFCGSGSVGSADPKDYASFMRYAQRSSLAANYALSSLGFRCAADLAAAEVAMEDCCAGKIENAEELPEDSVWRVGATWRDQHGVERSMDEFRGRPVVTAMIFTNCAYACPRTMNDLIAMREALPEELRAQVHWLLVSFDDVRDLPERLAAFAAEQKLEPEAWTLLHGSAEAVRTWAAAMGIRYKKTADGGFSHSNRITLLDPTGRVAARWDGLGVPAEPAAKDIATLVAGFRAE